MLSVDKLNFTLPKNLIANAPVSPRDHSKLLVLDRLTGSIQHKHFYDLIDLVRHSDVLVFNDTKVFPARLFGKRETGGKVEVLFIKETEKDVWEILGKNIPSVNHKIIFSSFYSKVLEKGFGTAKVEVFTNGKIIEEILTSEGRTPVPPYISSKLLETDLRNVYQTAYAKTTGSIAAPTAGFHFTEELLAKLAQKGVQMEFVTLHVGMGTFTPIKDLEIAKHKMHSENYALDAETAERLNSAKAAGKRIISVGTTTTRVLESCTVNSRLMAETNETDIFIYPPYKFKFVDALITNFHLPHSTLLALTSAFVSKPNTNNIFKDFRSSLVGKAYKEAIKNKYRFYSFGDAMFIQ